MQKPASSLRNMILVLVIIAVLSALILGETYKLTQEPIQKAKDALELQALTEVLPAAFNNNPFEEKVVISRKDKRNKLELYPARQDGTITGIAVKTYTNQAFGGHMEMIVGFRLDGSLNGYKIIDQKETPGLGSKVLEEKFAGQFKNLHPERAILKVRQDGGDIDAVTAATISSRAVIDAVQRAVNTYNKFNQGKNHE